MRDEVVDFVHEWQGRVPAGKREMLTQIGIGASKFYDWERRYGQDNQHNGQTPREGWLEEWEQEAILRYDDKHPGEGYRRLSYMMLCFASDEIGQIGIQNKLLPQAHTSAVA